MDGHIMTVVRLAYGGSRVEAEALQNPANDPALLVSYWYRKGLEKTRDSIIYRDYVLDSGAFSAKHAGAVIVLDEFIEYCQETMKNDPKCTEIYALDVIDDHVQSLKNAEKMWNAGVPAIPCWHIGEPFSALTHIAKNYPKIAIGGLTTIRGSHAKIAWAQKCMKMVWPAKVHGFGCGSETVILAVPFHSVDATSWSIRPQRFGQWQSLKIDAATSHPVRKNHKLELEVAWYLKLEDQARHRWKKEMALLETLP